MGSKLEILEEQCKKCESCDLHKTRTNIVFADGDPDSAKIILIGEAPGENEDLQGKPFVGRAGKLLNMFLEQADISRQEDLYILNTIKCRPPKNRVPSKEEKAACEHFMKEQILEIDPKIILLCGATAMRSFISDKNPISKIRGNFFDIEVSNKTYKAMPIFHPSYLLRNHSIEINSPRYYMLKDLKKAKSLIV